MPSLSKNMTKIIGLTGGIASGKSTVTACIRQAGFQVIDADQVVHDLQAKGGKLYQALLGWLGEDILTEDGELNRPLLGQLIFSSQDNRQRSAQLQGLIIRQALAEERDRLAQTEEVFFMDIPLLIENDYMDWFDEIWLVALDSENQKERLMRRNHLSEKEANQRIDSQMPLAQKIPYADLVLDNNGSLEELREAVAEALERLKEM